MENSTSVIVAFITGVIGPITILYTKYLFNKMKKKPDMVMDTLRVSELVNVKIDQIREEYHADRVWVAQFHNGGNFYPTGKSMAKFSIMYESVSQYANSIQSSFHNIPVNLFAKSINQLLLNEVIEIPDFKDETVPTFGLKYIAEENGCKSGYIFAVKTIDDKFIGIMGLDFTKRKTKLDLTEINHLEIHATSLGGVLMTHLAQ
jgi:hypothetical protein